MLALASVTTACSELQARRHAREGNTAYLGGDYAAAVREYEAADQLHAGLHVVALNKGLACRQLLVPGGKSPENERNVNCALDSFKRMSTLRPEDKRGEQLYVQTLFDADRFDTLAAIYEEQLKGKPNDLAAINGLISVYSRADNFPKTLEWTSKRADVDRQDAEAQYAVGVLVYNRLYQKGGADKGTYNPWPDPNLDPKDKTREIKLPPPFSVGDVMGSERVRLADLGVSYLNRALELRPAYREAMGFLSLVYRQKSYAYLDKPEDWQACTTSAEQWHAKTTATAASPEATPS